MFAQFLLTTILLLSAFTASVWIWRWISNLVIARKYVMDHAEVDDPSCIVTLVHGTFARNAPWTSPVSNLVGRLQDAALGRVQVRIFSWSGLNSFGARARAAAVLANDIENLPRHQLKVPHYLVGHSHGGNVAMSAALALKKQTISGVVCLATPFLTTYRRRLTRSRQIMIGFGFFLVLCLPFINLPNMRDGELANFQVLILLGAAPCAMIWTLWASSLSRRLALGVSITGLDPRRVAFIRAPFDEASGLIGTVSFVNWLLGRISSGPFEILDRFERPRKVGSLLWFVLSCLGVALVGAIAIYIGGELPSKAPFAFVALLLRTVGAVALIVSVALVALAVVARPLRLARDRFWVMLIFWPVFLVAGILGGALLVPAIVIASILFAAAVGVEMLICSIFMEVAAEPCPAGRWTLRQLPAPPEGRLRHSSVYGSDEALGEIIAALATMPERHFLDPQPLDRPWPEPH